MSNELIKSVSIENLLQKRDAIIERFAKVQELAGEIKGLIAMFGDTSVPEFQWEFRGKKHNVTNYYSYQNDPDRERKTSADDYRKAIDQLGWKYLMEESGNLALMDAKERDKWRTSLDEYKFPELILENIAATFQDMHATRGEMFDRGVINVFKSLSWEYKTNSPFRLTKKIIIRYFTGYSSSGGEQVDDLIRCFHVLDGKPIPEYRHSIRNQIHKFRFEGEDTIENEYVFIKMYGNGNGHVTFKRLDLVTKLNEIVARHFPFHIPHDNKAA